MLRLSFVTATVGIIYAQVDDSRYVEAVDNPNDNFENLWLYYMAGSSGAVLPYSIVGTIAMLMLIVVVKHSREHSKRKKSVTNISGDVFHDVLLLDLRLNIVILVLSLVYFIIVTNKR